MAEIGISMTLLRSLIIGVLAVIAARPVLTLLADRHRPVRRIAWVFLLAPFFTPVLLTGYAYANFSLSLIHHPVINTIFYSALLWWKFTPIAAVILHFTPAPISAEAIHCRRLISSVGSVRCGHRTPPRGVSTMAFKFKRLGVPHPGRMRWRAGCGIRCRIPIGVRRV